MSARGVRLRLRLFLEGVEVPVIGAQIQCLPNAPVMAAIQIPPLSEGLRLLPRTLVHLFFFDFYEDENPFIGNRFFSDLDGEVQPTRYQDRLDAHRHGQSDTRLFSDHTAVGSDTATDPRYGSYKVVFCGEVIGLEWTKSQANRALILQCADPSNYWDYAYQWTNTGLFGPGIKAMFSGGSTNLFTDFLSSKAEVLTNILRTPSITFPKLKGLAGGIVHLLESIGGSYYYDRKVAGQNIFFTLAELRLHINQMIMAIEDDPTASRLLANQGYGGLFSRLLGGMGGQTSIRKSITALQGIIFHETYGQPCPKYVPGVGEGAGSTGRRSVADDPSTSFIAHNALSVLHALRTVKQQLRVADNLPDVNIFESATQARVREEMSQRLRLQRQLLRNTIVRLRGVSPQVPSALSLLTTAAQDIGQAATRLSRWSPTNEASIAAVEGHIETAVDRLWRAYRLTVTVKNIPERSPPRLAQQILRPDVWFSAPPRCNVLFPEHYDQLMFRRQFLEEPTRLLLKTNDEFFGEDELFDRFYFAPKTRSVNKSKAQLSALLRNDVLEHELFTGILPVFEKMGELNIFAARGGIAKGQVPQVGLAQRSANFLYFKYRFAARQMVVSGRFNPYIAIGFPGLIIDKYVDQEVLELHNELIAKAGGPTRNINKLLGTHFLGNFTQCTFNISQSSAKTDIVLSYPRTPDESVEFLGATDLEERSVSMRFNEDAVRTTDVAAVVAPRISSPGPNLGQVIGVEDVTDIYRSNPLTVTAEDPTGTKPLLLMGKIDSKPRSPEKRVKARVPIGVEFDARVLPKTVLEELGVFEAVESVFGSSTDFYSMPRMLTISAFRLQEQVPRFRQEVVDLPAEEYIRPGWYGDIWHPASIGKAYQTFFGTGAITDPHVVTDPEAGTSYRTLSERAAQAVADGSVADSASDPRGDAPTQYLLRENASIEQAVGFLVATYSHIKNSGLDVEEFIRSYTWRPIASMIDMFGTSDLVLSPDGAYVLQGIEGFHSRAFGPFNDLFGLVTANIEEVVGIKRGTTAAQRGDTRKAKQDAVKDYLAALGINRAILG